MVAAGQIRRLSKGRFYKPQITESGELLPDTFQTIKKLIENIGYIAGYTVFNELVFGELKLLTQSCNVLQIGTAKIKKAIIR
ncbi:MAG: hypothetical protein LBH06_09875 [Rikenellaceae bacterium]|jgi:hypothetical protein|nr:hypothetical protein [Rikenellaceae bacterium]